jgi:hypothetical protein
VANQQAAHQRNTEKLPVPTGQVRRRAPAHTAMAKSVAQPDPRLVVSDIIALRRKGVAWDAISLQVGVSIYRCRRMFDEALKAHLTLPVDDYMRWELDHLIQVSVQLLDLPPSAPAKTVAALVKLTEIRMRLMNIGAPHPYHDPNGLQHRTTP